MDKKIENIIIKFLTKEANLYELGQLELWIHNSNNEKLFHEYIKTNALVNGIMNTYDAEKAIKKIEDQIAQKKPPLFRKNKRYNLVKYAAAVTLLFGLGYFFQTGYFSNKQNFNIPSTSVTLKLENGNVKVLNKDSSTKVINISGNAVVTQNGNQLVYSNTLDKQKLVYNILTVPYGKRFEVLLSDGTNVHLNSGTTLKYPVKFIKGKNRQVFLKGEAFFDVTTDKEHPFIVNADALTIEVFGTEFNVSAYKEDAKIDVFLVEGSVGLYNSDENLKQKITITPGTKGTLDRKQNSLTSEKVDINIYTQWMQGGLVFRNSTFENISKKLERHYNVKIINKNKQLNKEVFNASFNKEPIDVILSSFSDSYNIEYTIEDNIINIY